MKTAMKIIGVTTFAVAIGVGFGLLGSRDTGEHGIVQTSKFVAIKPATSAVKTAIVAQQGIKLEAHVNAQFDNK
jgi:hypothetical protein